MSDMPTSSSEGAVTIRFHVNPWRILALFIAVALALSVVDLVSQAPPGTIRLRSRIGAL